MVIGCLAALSDLFGNANAAQCVETLLRPVETILDLHPFQGGRLYTNYYSSSLPNHTN